LLPFYRSTDRVQVNFWEHFLRLLPHRPLPALAALYWHVTRRRIRARNLLRVASVDLAFTYDMWMAQAERLTERVDELRLASEQWSRRPTFSILLHSAARASPEELERSISSARRQTYPFCALLEDVDTIADGVDRADSDYLVPLRAGDALSECALFRFAEALQSNRDAPILYGDEDRLDARGRRSRPWFKPRWNEEMFLAQDYLSSAVAVQSSLAREIVTDSAPKTITEFLLAATSTTKGPILHVPHIIAHVADPAVPERDRVEAVDRHLKSVGATAAAGPFGTVRVRWPLPERLPVVTIIIPTKDKVELLRPCVEGVLERTNYESFEVLIVDNGSVEQRTAEYLRLIGGHSKVRVLSYPGPYNFSAINNFAVSQAQGTYLCLLNNDTDVVEEAWLTEMMRYAVRPHIGAVGAKLLYEDGSIQHAGVIIGIGGAAGHAHRFLPADQPGYFCMPHVAQFTSAVTAACLVVERKKYEAVGGFDDVLAVAFNDVDFCLKLEAAGWRNVYVPHAVLLHHESKSRGNDISPQNIDRYRRELRLLQDRWGTKDYADPLHNPNLDLHSESFVIGL
jgi:GT2 family glycosyltransferase